MANLALKNNTGTSTEITMTNSSGSEWKIINDNGTFKLNGKGNLLFTMSDSGSIAFKNDMNINLFSLTDTGVSTFVDDMNIDGKIKAYQTEENVTASIYAGNNTGKIGLQVNGVSGNDNDSIRGLLDVTRNQYMLWYNPTKDRQYLSKTYTGNSFYIRNYFEISNDSYWPSMYFKSSNDEESYMGRISYGLCVDEKDTSYNTNSMYFYHYSYEANTRNRKSIINNEGKTVYPYERFRLPKTDADLTTQTTYNILTSKNDVTIAQGGTGASNAADARANLGAAALAADNTFACHLTLNNTKYIKGKKTDGTVLLLLGVSSGNNIIIGDANYVDQPINMYGKLNVTGTIRATDNSISAYTANANTIQVYAQNSVCGCSLIAHADGRAGLFHKTNDQFILYYHLGNKRYQQRSTYFTGSVMSATGSEQIGTKEIPWSYIMGKNIYIYDTNVKAYGSFRMHTEGTAEASGLGLLTVGNSTTGAAGQASGQITIYSTGKYGGIILPPEGTITGNLNFYMPNAEGTFVTHATRGTAVGSASQPVYIASTGRATKITSVDVAYGGTGATSAAGARANIVYIGKNPITKLADDTNSKWGALESGIAYFDTLNQLNGQPAQYGMLLNMTTGGTVSGQLWITTGGVGYLRGSGSSGFSNWYKLWSSKDTLFTNLSSTPGTSGETLSITVGGVTKTLALDAAGANQGGIITTGSQTIAGVKTFNSTPVIRGTDPAIFFRPDSTERQMIAIQNYITEDNTKITDSYLRILQYSYTKGTKTALATYETYRLPSVDESRTKNATYEIFTSKNYSTLDGRYVNISGDTMTGDLTVSDTTNSATVKVHNDNGEISLHASSNRGIYDHTRDKWLIYTLATDNTTRISDSLYPGSKGALDIGSTTYPFSEIYSNAMYVVEHTSQKGYGNLRIVTQGTTSTVGVAQLNVGNSTPKGTAGNSYGRIYLGTEGEFGDYLYPSSSAITANKYFYFPDEGGTLVTMPTRGTAQGSSSKPVYIAANGKATAITSLNIGTNAITCGTITCSRIIATATADADEDTQTATALTLGDTKGQHIIIDGNEIIAKNKVTAMGSLYLRGSSVEVSKGVFKAGQGLAINTDSYGTNESEITNPVTGQIYLKYV